MATLDVGSLGEYIRSQRESAQVSLRELARTAGVSNPYLSQVERGLRRPSATVLGQLAKALRISAETLYVQAGLLDERPESSAVLEAIVGDPTLSDRQRRVLQDIYTAFQSENRSQERSEHRSQEQSEPDHGGRTSPHPAPPTRKDES